MAIIFIILLVLLIGVSLLFITDSFWLSSLEKRREKMERWAKNNNLSYTKEVRGSEKFNSKNLIEGSYKGKSIKILDRSKFSHLVEFHDINLSEYLTIINKKTLGFISRFLPGQAMIRFYVTEIYLNNKLIDDGCSPYDVMSINWNEGIAGPNRILPFDKLIDILDSK